MPKALVRIRRIEFSNFKALRRYSLALNDINILVGPNNSGKSTLIGALRTLDAALRFARSGPPTRVTVGDKTIIGYRIPEESVPISLENVQSDYNSTESRVTFFLSNGNSIAIVFPTDGGCILIPQPRGKAITSTAVFKSEFPLSLVIVPVLGPVEHREQRRERRTVVASLSTHRASRHFRSYWHFFPEGFDTFAKLVAKTWPGMEIHAPEYNGITGELSMFCLEERMTRELFWVGFGFQIWCQLLTHVSRANNESLIVVDEPEVYLHPDVQRQLLGIIRNVGADVLLATHSSEIIAEADPSEIIMMDKRRQTGERLKNVADLQRALETVGSSQNITLTAIAKNRRILFVEGLEDFRLLRRFAQKIGLQELSSGSGITPLASGGFGSWQKITHLAAGIAEAIGAPFLVGALYDRDYFCDEQITEVVASLTKSLAVAHVFQRKEAENYLLVPSALDRAVEKAISGKGKSDKKIDSTLILDQITKPKKSDVLAQLLARASDHHGKQYADSSALNKKVVEAFETQWSTIESRMNIIPGKQTLSEYRQIVQETYKVTLTDARILEAFHKTDLAPDLLEVLTRLDSFRTATPGKTTQHLA